MGVSVEGVIAFWVCAIVLVTAHKVIGKFALVLYVVVFLVGVIAAAQWLEVDPFVLLYSILGGGLAVVLVLALIGYMKGIR
jgi:hypothetical protein